MIDDGISALAKAWLVSMTAITLLFVALAVEPIWDVGIYKEALRQTLTMQQQF